MRYILHHDATVTDNEIVIANAVAYASTELKTQSQEITIRPYKEKRRKKQNAYYWGGVISQIVRWKAEHEGVSIDPMVLHDQMKRLYQPIIGSYPFSVSIVDDAGVTRLVKVEIPVPKSTTDNDVKDMAEYTEKVIAHWVNENVVFEDYAYIDGPYE